MDEFKTEEQLNEEIDVETPEVEAEASEEQESTKSKVWAEVFSWIKIIVIALVIALIINNFIIIRKTKIIWFNFFRKIFI